MAYDYLSPTVIGINPVIGANFVIGVHAVLPANAGIQPHIEVRPSPTWIPAFAGTTWQCVELDRLIRQKLEGLGYEF